VPIVADSSGSSADRPPGRPGVGRAAWVVGVDTHTDTHTAALLDPLGAVHAQIQIEASPDGYVQLLAWAGQHLPAGTRMVWAVEGTRSHGHGLTRHLQAAGQSVIEAPKPVAARRRRGGKSDPVDAIHAGQAALAVDQTTGRHAVPRADGQREALRLLLVTRRHYTDTRTASVNVFKAAILGATDLRETLRNLSTTAQVRTVLTLPEDPATDVETRIRLAQLRILARTIADLDTILTDNMKQLRTLVRAWCKTLLALPGVGPHTAATLLVAWSHPGRVRNEAAFAALAGTSPIITGSGRRHRHRLNRGGDRALNSALHTIASTRRRMNHPATSDYITRRTQQGHTYNDIRRSIKRYLARHLYRIIQTQAVTP
jgi:transposase